MSTLLTADNISISFGGIKAVQNVSFQMETGEILGLIGPNGSGKSTCVNLISGVYPLDTGKIIFNGRELTPKDDIADRARLGIGRTFQSPRPFINYTVYDNVFSIALQRHSHKEAAEKTRWCLELTALDSMADMISGKLPIEKRKWLDLARVLTTDAKLIMMDEVMAGLNPREMEESIELVHRINKQGVTILFIEHVMKAVVAVCSKVIVLNEGRFLCEGTPAEVLQRQDVIEAYLGGGSVHA